MRETIVERSRVSGRRFDFPRISSILLSSHEARTRPVSPHADGGEPRLCQAGWRDLRGRRDRFGGDLGAMPGVRMEAGGAFAVLVGSYAKFPTV